MTAQSATTEGVITVLIPKEGQPYSYYVDVLLFCSDLYVLDSDNAINN